MTLRELKVPNWDIEDSLFCKVVGVDEAGRGPLAGPVVAAAVILPRDFDCSGINDSKKISAKKRELLYERITANAVFGVGLASPEEIDQINILQATFLSMKRALDMVKEDFGCVIVDGNMNPFAGYYPSQAIIKGDSKSFSIAAASIVAKVTRDRLMHAIHNEYPHYNWVKNSGYGTKEHIAALRRYGRTEYHRASFIKSLLYN